MSLKFRLPSYFANSIRREIGELYASTAIADLSIAIVVLFEPIFLYQVLKLSLGEVLLFFALVYGCYIVFIPFGAKIVSWFGYEHGILFSIPFQILYWLLLFGSEHSIYLVYLAPIALAVEKSLFWPSFHAICSRFARDNQRGREFSVLYAIVNIAHIVGPFIGGLIAEHYGVKASFIVASIIYSASFIPLFSTKEVFIPKIYMFRDTISLYRRYWTKALGYMGFGEEMLVLTVWPIFIYLVIKDYEDTGLLVTVATLIATVLALYIGKVTDSYSKQLLVKVGSFFYFLVWLARLVIVSTWGVFALDSLSRTSKDLVFIPVSTLVYERAESTKIMPYVVFFEQSLAIGKLIAALLAIVIFSFVGSFLTLGAAFIIVFALAGVFSLLYMLI